MKKLNLNKFATPVLFAAAIIWGSAFIVVKESVDSIPTNWILFMRFGIAAIFLSAVFWKRLKKIDRKHLLGSFWVALTLYIAYILQTVAIKYTSPGKNAFITAAYCVMVPFLIWIFHKKRPDKFNIIAAVVCIIGIGLTAVNPSEALSINKGDALTFLCAIFFALQILAIDNAVKDCDPVLITILQFAFGAVFALIGALIFEQPPTMFGKSEIFCTLYLGIMSSGVATLCQIVGQKYAASQSSAAIILSLESVFGIIFSVMFGYEKLTALMAIGFALIFAAVVTSETKLDFFKRKVRC